MHPARNVTWTTSIQVHRSAMGEEHQSRTFRNGKRIRHQEEKIFYLFEYQVACDLNHWLLAEFIHSFLSTPPDRKYIPISLMGYGLHPRGYSAPGNHTKIFARIPCHHFRLPILCAAWDSCGRFQKRCTPSPRHCYIYSSYYGNPQYAIAGPASSE